MLLFIMVRSFYLFFFNIKYHMVFQYNLIIQLKLWEIYEVDPLVSPKCGFEMKILPVIMDPKKLGDVVDYVNIGILYDT
jgi:hypothetical protein